MRTEVEQLHSELELNRSGLSSPAKPSDSNEKEEDDLDRTGNTNSNMSAAMRSSASSLDQVDREKFGLLEVCYQYSFASMHECPVPDHSKVLSHILSCNNDFALLRLVCSSRWRRCGGCATNAAP
jgi:hypothetical protein